MFSRDGHQFIDDSSRYISVIQVMVMFDTSDCEIPNLNAKSSSNKPKRSLQRVSKYSFIGVSCLTLERSLSTACPLDRRYDFQYNNEFTDSPKNS